MPGVTHQAGSTVSDSPTIGWVPVGSVQLLQVLAVVPTTLREGPPVHTPMSGVSYEPSECCHVPLSSLLFPAALSTSSAPVPTSVPSTRT